MQEGREPPAEPCEAGRQVSHTQPHRSGWCGGTLQRVQQVCRHVVGREGGRLLAAVAVKDAEQRHAHVACGRKTGSGFESGLRSRLGSAQLMRHETYYHTSCMATCVCEIKVMKAVQHTSRRIIYRETSLETRYDGITHK